MDAEEEPPHHGVYAPSPRASNFPLAMHSWRDDDKVIDSEDEAIEYSSHSSEYSDTDRSILDVVELNAFVSIDSLTEHVLSSSSTPRPTMTDIEDLIVGLTTSASISSTTDTQILRKMDPASTPKPTTCAIDSQIPECTENVSMLLSPEALFGQMTTEPVMSGIEDQIPTKASSLLTTDTPMENLASSLPGHTMDNLDTRGKNVNLDMNSVCKFSLTSPSVQISANPSEGPGRPADDPGRFPEGPGHPSEGSGRPSEGPERPKWFQNVVVSMSYIGAMD
ncbi:hypothetical protein F5051DRAFT_447647 [Lentinula edodes]|nr:hypothetical protein F5051DRAFT_447647 [Lentinula edodes]